MTPQLVSMSGMPSGNYDNYLLNKKKLTNDEYNYLSSKYPELMGFWNIAIPAIASIVTAVAPAFVKKSSPQNVTQQSDAQIEELKSQLQAINEKNEQDKARTQQFLMFAAAAGIPMVLMITMMGRRKSNA